VPLSRVQIHALIAIAAAQLWLGLLWFFYWGHGIERGVILAVVLAGLIALRFVKGPTTGTGPVPAPRWLIYVAGAAVVLNIILMVVSTTHSWRTGHIPMDEGETSWRAARILDQGHDPYGAGALVDFAAFRTRLATRQTAGIGPTIPAADIDPALQRYDQHLDTRLRRKLLPAPGHATGVTSRETSVLGYKYGPLLLLATALLVPLGVPALVLLLNGMASFGLYATMWAILRRVSRGDMVLALAALIALLLDRHITRNYINRSATDVWSLLFGALGVLAFLSRKPVASAAALAVAVGCKILPGLAFFPILLRYRSTSLILVFAAILFGIYLPWLLWDARGIVSNVFLWPFLMTKDSSSWQFFVPAAVAMGSRLLALAAMAIVWLRYLTGRESRLFWTLAMSNVLLLLGSGFLRNGYVPWASLWIVAAIVEAYAEQEPDHQRTSILARGDIATS
jgi:hypothetical protein